MRLLRTGKNGQQPANNTTPTTVTHRTPSGSYPYLEVPIHVPVDAPSGIKETSHNNVRVLL